MSFTKRIHDHLRTFLKDVPIVPYLTACALTAALTAVVDIASGIAVGRALSINAYPAIFGGSVCFLTALSLALFSVNILLDSLFQRLRRPKPSDLLFGIFFTLAFLPAFYALSVSITSGEWIANQSFVWAVFAAPLILGPACTGLAATAYIRYIAPVPLKKGLFSKTALLLFVLATGGVTVILYLLPFRYNPTLSLILWSLSLIGIFALILRLFRVFHFRVTTTLKIALPTIVAIAMLSSVVYAFLIPRSLRSEIVDKSVTMGEVFRKIGSFGSYSLLYEALLTLDVSEGFSASSAELPEGLIKNDKNWNILLVVVDGLRADALPPNRKKGLPHAGRKDTPFIDKWMKDAYVFRYAYAQGSRTHVSMPAMFRSLQPFEDTDRVGTPLGVYMKSKGRNTIASVPALFVQSFRPLFQHLLRGFDQVLHQDIPEQAGQVPNFLNALKSAPATSPLFAWIHMYYLHSPGFASKPLARSDGSRKQRYRKTLSYSDQEFGKLMEGIKKLGMDRNTIVIFTADHGENLGDNKVTSHGFTVFEEATRVPLIIKIPGRKGRIINTTVGNIDILPTIADLLNEPILPQYSGKSLVPLMVNPKLKWNRDYFTKNAVGEMISLVRGRDKLIHDIEADTIYRYDLQKDPTEDTNLFNAKGSLDRRLLLGILKAAPERFAPQLKDRKTQDLLLDRISQLTDESPEDVVAFLSRLAISSPDLRARQRVVRLFSELSREPLKLTILKTSFSSNPKVYGRLLKKYLSSVKSPAREEQLVTQLYLQNQQPFENKYVSTRIADHAKQKEFKQLSAWLRMTANWNSKPFRTFEPAFSAILNDDGNTAVPPNIVRLTLDNIATSRNTARQPADTGLPAKTSEFLFHPDPNLRAAACKALGVIGNRNSVDTMIQMMKSGSQPLQVKQAFLQAVYAIEKQAAVPIITEYGKDFDLQVDVIQILEKLRSKEGIPFLQYIAENHPNSYFRSRAKKAVKLIEKRK